MQIQLTTDNHIRGSEELTRHVESVVETTLARFGGQITRVEVHLTDENSSVKKGDHDKRCVMEARLAGIQPITVKHEGATLEQVLDGAAEKLESAIDHTLGRLHDRKGRMPHGGETMV